MPLSKAGITRLSEKIEEVKFNLGLKRSISVQITGDARTHFGFGTGTVIRLACLEALMLVNEHTYTQMQLAGHSGRGGTSGIGIFTYFNGGFIFDIGHSSATHSFRPSSFQEDRRSTPLLLKQTDMPPWHIGICIPLNLTTKTEQQELAFFQKTCPISSNEAYKTLYYATYGLQAAVIENDVSTFCNALKEIQECAWKLAERTEYGPQLSSIETALYKCGASAVGMSSLGPSLFYLAEDIADVSQQMHKREIKTEIILTCPSNRGRMISYA